jgi:hypothetical protein
MLVFTEPVLVTADGVPPTAATWNNADPLFGVNTMTPFAFHAPGSGASASQSVMTRPPATSIFLSFPPATNAMN